MTTTPFIPPWLDWPQTKKLVRVFSVKPGSLRFVGGAVRDGLLGKPVQDVDVATTLLPDEVMALLEKEGIRVMPTGITHGTVTAVVDKKHFEITTLRKDTACDGRHAEVEFTTDWKEDASRRDFTINTIYLSPEGELFDYFEGQDDIKSGNVRFIGDANQRISEDYLRILRFFRFYAYYGQINGKWSEVDSVAVEACAALASHMSALSGERIQHELFRLLSAPSASETLRIMHDHKILPHVLGFGVSDCTMFVRFETIGRVVGIAVTPSIKLAAFVLKTDINEENAFTKFARRLRLSNNAEKTLQIVLQHCREIHPGLADLQQKRLIRKLGAENFRWCVVVGWALGKEPIASDHVYSNMLQMGMTWRVPVFPLGGEDLIARGIKPGKALGETLKRLEDAWEASDYTMDRDGLISLLLR